MFYRQIIKQYWHEQANCINNQTIYDR